MRFVLLCILTSALVIAGCSSAPIKPEPIVVRQFERVVVVPPPALLQLPPPVPALDVEKSTQADVAGWLVQKLGRCTAEEQQIVDLSKWFTEQK